MYAVVIFGTLAFSLCFFATPLCRDLALRLNLVDNPDTDRRFHSRPIPRVGGVAIMFSYAAAMGLMFLLAPHSARIYIQHSHLMMNLLLPAGLVFLLGLVDDIFGLKPWQKLAGQIVASGLAVSLGARVATLHGLPASPWITIPFSIIWLLGCTNAVNLIDGMDGLATGVSLFATAATIVAACINGNIGLAMATVPLAGCLLAFLRYNFSPATIFLGDCGSLTVGFMLGCFGLIWSRHGGTLFGMTLPVMALALPLLDSLLSIGRRALRSVSIFKGDRGHIHHMILARGIKPGKAVLILYAFCTVAASLALLQTFIDLRLRAPIFILFGWLIWAGLNYLGYVEFRAVARVLSKRHIFALLSHEIRLQELLRSLEHSQTVEQFWELVRKECAATHCSSVRMSFGGQMFSTTFDKELMAARLTMTVELGDTGTLELTHTQKERPARLLSFIHYVQAAAALKENGFMRTALLYHDAA